MSGHKGMIEFDKLVVIVIALAVLLFVVILFKTGFGSVGGSVAQVSKTATGQTDKTSGTISGALGKLLKGWGVTSGEAKDESETTPVQITPGSCYKGVDPAKTTCISRGGVCATAKVCSNSDGYWNNVWTCPNTGDGCCCNN